MVPLTCILVAHRDIKTSNVLLRSNDHALISDFGLAIALTNSSSNPQQNGTLDGAPGVGDNKQDIDVNRLKQCGTPRYLSPELLEGPMDVHNFADAFRQGKIPQINYSGRPLNSVSQFEWLKFISAI